MPHPCVVCGRSRMNPNNREEDYMFFGFPVNYEERCRKWLEFCCREDLYKLTKKQLLQRMVCSKHFERKDFLNEYQDRLNCTGVPSIYEPSQSLYNITCVLCGKFRRDPPSANYDGTTFHHFPGEEFRCLKWLDFVGIDSYYRLTRKEILYCYICSNHFDKSQFVAGFKARLVDNAVPNIRRPGMSIQSEVTLKPVKPMEIPKTFTVPEKLKRYEPLTTAVLESQACAACGRSRSDPRNRAERYKFHPFPAYEIGRCLRWCQFLGREDLLKMSPNQIRKLVLCSKHFLAGQSFHKIGPCDAVPTIKEVTDIAYGTLRKDQRGMIGIERDDNEEEEEEEEEGEVRSMERHDRREPMVSSKKPKIDNKPAPLAKKRGRSRRPTSINLPQLDNLNIENRVRKVAIPAANWKIQFANNQFQPLTIANANNTGNPITTEGKKVILPFTGNISNLGAPIPVHSLSSIPPGFLIKINLPEQGVKKPARASRKQTAGRKKTSKDDASMGVNGTCDTGKIVKRRRTRRKKVDQTSDETVRAKIIETFSPASPDKEETIRTSYKREIVEHDEDIGPDVIEVLDNEFVDLEGSYDLGDEDDQIHVYEEIPSTEIETEEDEILTGKKLKKHGKRTTMTTKTRRTLMPIRTEVRNFLHKLKPHMSRLPRKAKAQLKLLIVNLVIDRL